jgi:hypothetical protein
VKLLEGAFEDDGAVEEDDNSGGELLDLLEVLRGEHHCPLALPHLARHVPEPAPLSWIEGGCRLVEEENVGPREESNGQVEALLVSRGEMSGQAAVVGQLEYADEAAGPLHRVVDILQAGKELEVLSRREPRVVGGSLRHPADLRAPVIARGHVALARLERACEDGEQRGLPGPVRPDQGDGLAGVDVQGRRRERDDAPVAAGDAADAQEHGGQRPPPLASSASTPRIMTPAPQPYDYEWETPANGGRVVPLRPLAWDWSFETDGALALAPEVATNLKGQGASVTVPRMARPEAQGLAYRAAEREETRARVRSARRSAALLVAACVSLVLLLLTAFGTGGVAARVTRGPAPADRLLPAGPPRAQVVALQDTLRIQMPINQTRVTAIGYHAAGTDVLPLQPVGSQANAGLVKRLFHRLFGDSGSAISYYQLGGGAGPQTGGLDVGAPVDTDVYAPVAGSVMAISDMIVNGKAYGVRIDIQPSGSPGVVVTLENLKPDPALTVGSAVSAGRTKIGSVIDLSQVERAALARVTQDRGQHVHIEVRAASGLASP